MVRPAALALVSLLSLAPACRTPAPEARATECAAPSRVEVCFGMSSPDGRGVSEQQWQAFLSDTLLPRFPALTVLEAQGVWQDEVTLAAVREDARVVVVAFAPAEFARVQEHVRAAAAAYKLRFAQQAVLALWSAATHELL